MIPELKGRNQLKRVERNGYVFYMDPNPLAGVCYLGGGGGNDIEYVDPLQGTGVRDLYKQLSEMLKGQIGKGLTPYQGQIAPGASQLQQQGFQTAGGLSPLAQGGFDLFQQAQPGGAAGQDMLNLGQQGLQDIMQPFDPTSTQERFEANMEPAFNLFQDRVMPAIEEAGVNRSGSGSAGGTQRSLARAGTEFSTNMASQLANSLFGAEQAHLGRQSQGVNQAGNLAGIPGSLINQAGQTAGMGSDLLTQMMKRIL